MSSREKALDILLRVERENAFATSLLDSGHGDERDQRFVRTIVLGVLRWRSRLDRAIEVATRRRINKLDRTTLELLRIGVYQIRYMDVPPHAAVAEVMKIAQKRAARSKPLINAALRAITLQEDAEEVPFEQLAAEPSRIAEETSHPEWMIARWVRLFGARRAAEIALANQTFSYPDLLLNTRKISREAAHTLLREKGLSFRENDYRSDFVTLRESTAVVAAEMRDGLFYAMDVGSAIVASAVSPGLQTLDVAAAPGGKSLVLALAGNVAVSNDLSMSRIQLLTRTHPAMIGGKPMLTVSDGRQLPFRKRFEAVLLDAPCSATGTIRRNPEVKWRLKEKDLEAFASLQKQLLHGALDAAARECIYSTCSLEPEENDDVVREVLDQRDDFELVALDDFIPLAARKYLQGHVMRLTPESGCDGFTVHKLQRKQY